MVLEGIIQSEINLTGKDKYLLSLYVESRKQMKKKVNKASKKQNHRYRE